MSKDAKRQARAAAAGLRYRAEHPGPAEVRALEDLVEEHTSVDVGPEPPPDPEDGPAQIACVDVASHRDGDTIVVHWRTPGGPEDSHTVCVDLQGNLTGHTIFETVKVGSG